MTSVPPGAKSTRPRSPGASADNFAASRTAVSLVVAARTKGQALHLLDDGRDHLRMAEARLVYVVAVEIKDAPPLGVLDVRAFAAAQCV